MKNVNKLLTNLVCYNKHSICHREMKYPKNETPLRQKQLNTTKIYQTIFDRNKKKSNGTYYAGGEIKLKMILVGSRSCD